MSPSEGFCGSMPRFAFGFVFGVAVLFAVMTCGTPIARAADVFDDRAIVTESGPLEGIVTAQINEYLGIPYAAPPVGALRWMPPRPFGRWQGVLNATHFGNQCPQLSVTVPPESVGDENCLFLNVYTPNVGESPDKDDGHANDQWNHDGHHGLAVMVWIHGGGLTQGAGSDFDPTPLVEGGGVIVVTINYRLGLLGFLAHPALDHEGHLAGNYGLMDQQFALGWVRRNIAAFGGNPHRVTVFGESAGGLSVYSQLASPLAAGLFQKAIAQSGAYASFADYLDRIIPIAVAETTGSPGVESGEAIADAVGCTSQTAACLRGPTVTAAALVNLRPHAIYPFIDGILLTQPPGAAFASGKFNRVPVITGTNHDEYRYFVARDWVDPTLGLLPNGNYAATVEMVFGTSVAANVLSQPEYQLPTSPPPPPEAASLLLGAAGTDGIFACTARHAMQSLAHYVTIYAYEFNDENAPVPTFPYAINFQLGAYHSADVQYLFNRGGIPAPFNKDQKQLSQTMIGYWTQFAKTGDPNSPGQPLWAPYDPVSDERLSLLPPEPVVESGFATDHECTTFWDLL